MSVGFHQQRSVTIIAQVQAYILETSIKNQAFADDVARIYRERVSNPKARSVPFHYDGEPSKDLKNNEQLLTRMLSRNVRFPADLEESVVFALPDPYRSNLLRELAARYGLLAARVPSNSGGDGLFAFQRLLKETSDVVGAMAPILADGAIDIKDRPHAKNALTQLNELMAEVVSIQQNLTGILPDDELVDSSNNIFPHLHRGAL